MPTAGVSRRDMLRYSAALGISSISPATARTGVGESRRPNIVFILADDLGYADLSCYGRTEYRTPAIDGLAERGVRFVQGYANSPVCSATRTALITGRYQYRLAVGLEEPLTVRDVGLPASHPTLPSRLRKAGYQTALIGKWHLGQLPAYGPLQSGYRHFWGYRGGGIDYFTHRNAQAHDLWDGDHPISAHGYLTDLLGDKAVEMIGRFSESEAPFFVSLHFSAPHWPWEGPDDRAESVRLSRSREQHDLDGGSMATYAAMVTRMDFQIGRLVAELNRRGLAEDTIIIFTSDNGGERFSNTWPFSGRKTELLEGGIRIPAIISWPRILKAGSVNGQVMMSMDWMPTLLSIAGARPDPGFPPDGIDLMPALTGALPIERTLFWRYLNMAQEACRSGDWKYLKILDNTFLFNVVEDPLERANLKARHPQRFASMRDNFQRWSSTMLPLDPAASSGGFSGADVADRFGIGTRRTVTRPLEPIGVPNRGDK